MIFLDLRGFTGIVAKVDISAILYQQLHHSVSHNTYTL